MKKHLDAAKRVLRSDKKNVLFFRSGADARFLASNGPWKGLSRSKKRAVIILPPFAEEMNRCRRLISLTQDALAQEGVASLCLDYFGTGDSAGEFGDARLADWMQDVVDVCTLAQSAGAHAITLLGVRFGALLAAHVAAEIPSVDTVFAVAPQESLQRAMRQFVRIAATTQDLTLKTKAGLRKPGASHQLENGQSVEIGGYVISPALYADFMRPAPARKSSAAITAVFVGSGVRMGQAPSPPEERQLKRLSAYSDTLSSSHMDDAQMWYQGVPEEPRKMPHSLAQAIVDAQSPKTAAQSEKASPA